MTNRSCDKAFLREAIFLFGSIEFPDKLEKEGTDEIIQQIVEVLLHVDTTEQAGMVNKLIALYSPISERKVLASSLLKYGHLAVRTKCMYREVDAMRFFEHYLGSQMKRFCHHTRRRQYH